MLLPFILHFFNFAFGVYIVCLVIHITIFFISIARGSVLTPEPVTIHKDISGMKIHSYVHCLL